MKITDACAAADRFMPNRFTFAEKLSWCNELSAMLSQEICKKYDYIECRAEDGTLPELPCGIEFDRIESVTVNGVLYTKSDLRTFDNSLIFQEQGDPEIRISYLKKYKPIRCIDFEGEYTVSDGFIDIVRPPFETSDLLKIITEFDEEGNPNPESAVYVYVTEVSENGIYISEGLEAQGSTDMVISRVITDETLAPMPYDKMYTEYLLSKYALHSGDYDAYRSFCEQFNITLDGYKNWYKARNPLSRHSHFNNYWR